MANADRAASSYRFFFPFDFLEPDGITLATVLAIELAILATTPFLEPRFFDPVVFFGLVFVVLVFDFVFVAAFFAITDSGTASLLQILLIRGCPEAGLFAFVFLLNSGSFSFHLTLDVRRSAFPLRH